MQHIADLLILTQRPGAWIGRLACVCLDVNKTLRPLYSHYIELWKRSAMCDRIYRSMGIPRTVNRTQYGLEYKETRIGHQARKIVYRETSTLGIFQTFIRATIYPEHKSITTLAVQWMLGRSKCWAFHGRALKMKCYDHEADIPALFEHMLEIYSWDWDCYHGPGDFKSVTEDKRMQAWMDRIHS